MLAVLVVRRRLRARHYTTQWPWQHSISSGEITVHNVRVVCRGAATELTRKWPRDGGGGAQRRVRTPFYCLLPTTRVEVYIVCSSKQYT